MSLGVELSLGIAQSGTVGSDGVFRRVGLPVDDPSYRPHNLQPV